MAVAAIQESLTGIRLPVSRKRTRSRAQVSATGWSTGSGSSVSASLKVASRRSRVSTSAAANTPERNSPSVITEIASSSGRSASLRRRPDSLAMNTLVSAIPRLNAGRQSYREPAPVALRPERDQLGGPRNGGRSQHALSSEAALLLVAVRRLGARPRL